MMPTPDPPANRGGLLLRTELCNAVGIDVPLIQAGMSVHTSPALVVAVSEAGALGSLGAWGRSAAGLLDGIRRIRERTDRPFAINHLAPDIDEESFALTLRAAVPVISFATGDPRDLVARAHDAGSLVTIQVTTAEHAEEAAELRADVIIGQGGEAGGYGGEIATTVLVPQVVRRVDPVPVVAAGGFVDGAGLVAAMALGAGGISVGTRFLTTVESPIHPDYRTRIVTAGASDAVKSPRFNLLSPKPGAVGTAPWFGSCEHRSSNGLRRSIGLRTWLASSRSWLLLSAPERHTSWSRPPDRVPAESHVSSPRARWCIRSPPKPLTSSPGWPRCGQGEGP